MGKILIIEDEGYVRSSIIDLLEAKGYETIEARDGLHALEVIKDVTPELVISDIMMPRMNGYQVLEAFQKNNTTAAIPFIFLTAKSDISDVRTGMNKGADDYIIKPFKAKELLEAIEVRLKKKRMADEKLNTLRLNITKYVPQELRSQLTSMLDFSEMILEDYHRLSSDEIYDMIDKIRSGSKRLHNTVEKFVLYSELEALLSADEAQQVPGTGITSNADEMIKGLVREKMNEWNRLEDLTISLEPCTLIIKGKYLKTLVDELIENACKFSASGQSIVVEGKQQEDHYKLSVTDHGKGMTAEQIEDIGPFMQFNKHFFQQSGNGLGLIIVRKITELCKGNFKIQSELNNFTRITVDLPIS